MKKKSMKILSLLLTLVMLLGLLPGMSLTAYATTDTDVYNLFSNLYYLMDQKYTEGDIEAYIALEQAYGGLEKAFFNAQGAITPEVETAYKSALAVYQRYSGGGGHTHSWNYQASGASVTATCTGNGDCDYKTNGVTLTISAPANLECDGSAKAAAISGEIPGGSGLSDPSNITYNPGGSSAPTEPGTYTASFTWGGANASVNFTLTAPAHTHSFTYSASGAAITATCGNTGCDITTGLTLSISAPTGNLVADGTTTFPATLSTGYNTTAFPANSISAISYTKDGQPFNGTPKDAGAYVASVTVGTGNGAATASVSYTIAAPQPTTYKVTYFANNGSGDTKEYNPNIGEIHTVEGQLFAAPQGKVFDNWLGDDNQTYRPGSQISTTRTLTAQWKDKSHGGGLSTNGDLVFFGGSGADGGWEYIGGGVPQRAYRLSFAPMQGGSAYFLLTSGENGETMNVYPQTTVRVVPTPAPGYRLASIVWSMIDGSASYDITESQTFVMPAMDAVVYVTFQPVA